ncbi:MAG: glycosyltransferase family 2 protein [Desulfocapsa sp.]|nr:glycosyltransferase family 2 protein [Desulfocapsa sp.]
METIDVVIPVLNEEASLPDFCCRLLALPLHLRPIFVDNGSTDNSCRIIKDFPGTVLIQHADNEGYGASLRDGIRSSVTEKIIIIDADGEYPPESIPEMVSALDNHEVVYGSRFAGKQMVDIPWNRALGNKTVTALFDLIFSQEITDLYTGFKGFKRQTVYDLPMHYNGFEHVLEIAARLARNKIRIHEIPVQYRLRNVGKSKMSHFQEVVKLLYLMVFFSFTIRACNRDQFR